MYSLTISGPHFLEMRQLLRPPNGHESGLLMLLGVADVAADPWIGEARRKYVSHSVVPIRKEDVVSSSAHHFEWRKSTFLNLLREAKDSGLAVAFAHSHRAEIEAYFSKHDDENDFAIAELARNSKKSDVDLLSIVLDDNDHIVARKCNATDKWTSVNQIICQDKAQWRLTVSEGGAINTGAFDRQVIAFGDGFLNSLSQLRITIVGAGATGSATAMLLARHGAHFIAVVDPDYVDLTNISRLHGANVLDAELKTKKVEVLKREIERIGLGTNLLTFDKRCSAPELQDLLRSSDVIFGCSDDHAGRIFLNRVAYFYNTPVFDMGIGIDPARNSAGHVQSVDGRLTCIEPGEVCQLCRGMVDPLIARDEELHIANPEEFQRQQKEGYVGNFDVKEPAVGYITTEVACMAIDELVCRLTGYRKPVSNRVRKFRLRKDTFPGGQSKSQCPLCQCQTHWGRGDMNPFLNRIG